MITSTTPFYNPSKISPVKIDLAEISPYIRYVNNYAPSWSFEEPERIIYDFELMYVADGKAVLWYDNVCYPLKKSDLFYLRPYTKNHLCVQKDDHFRIHCIHFDWIPPKPEDDFTVQEAYLNPIVSGKSKDFRLSNGRFLYEPNDFFLPVHIQNTPQKLNDWFSRCYYYFLQNTPVSRFLLKSLFMDILAELIVSYGSSQKRQQYIHPSIRNAIDYIQIHFKERLILEELAGKYQISPKYFGSLFKKSIGKSFQNFVLETRICAAKKLLESTDLALEEIALETGFQNVYYFSRCFKQMEHITPGKYRKSLHTLTP